MNFYPPTLVGALAIASVLLFVGRMKFFDTAGGRWVAASSGVAIAYVFVDILPHLAGYQRVLLSATGGGFYGYLEHHAYVVALIGFMLFLGIALFDQRALTSGRQVSAITAVGLAGFVGYSFLIGNILQEQADQGVGTRLIFVAAMAIHFAGLCHLLYQRAPAPYQRFTRFLLAAALMCGWLTGLIVDIERTTFALWFAFLAGGIIAVATAVELPKVEDGRRYAAFCGGAASFAGLLLLFEYLRVGG
ncbi:MAG: hypothetical protein QNJ73_17475 [Gammaproteobacteria bacterium]|nr:hypothetical protein [Gammaproteobacteria bacterium]